MVKVFSYVDDFLILLNLKNPTDLEDVSCDILNSFRSCSNLLNFTKELASDEIRLLDLKLIFSNTGHVCWMYAPRTKKQLLPFNSSYSKLVKRGIANLCFSNALKKSCHHSMDQSFNEQVTRLKAASFPDSVLKAVAETKMKKLKKEIGGMPSSGQNEDHRRVEVLPYIHKLSHSVNKVASRHGVRVVFSAPCKLSRLCANIEERN